MGTIGSNSPTFNNLLEDKSPSSLAATGYSSTYYSYSDTSKSDLSEITDGVKTQKMKWETKAQGSSIYSKKEKEHLEYYIEKQKELLRKYTDHPSDTDETLLKMIDLSGIYADIVYKQQYFYKALLTTKLYLENNFEKDNFSPVKTKSLLELTAKLENSRESYKKFAEKLVEENIGLTKK